MSLHAGVLARDGFVRDNTEAAIQEAEAGFAASAGPIAAGGWAPALLSPVVIGTLLLAAWMVYSDKEIVVLRFPLLLLMQVVHSHES